MNNGGPAFPVKEYVEAEPGAVTWGMHHGMSLRDWFAGMAMQGLNANDTLGTQLLVEDTAETAYRLADAMVKEREK